MPNYKESSVTGVIWQRAYQVLISNRFGEVPMITFSEEEVVDAGGRSITKHVGYLTEVMSDPTKSFDLINPVDGSVLGSATYQEAYVLLSSLYASLAQQRDGAV